MIAPPARAADRPVSLEGVRRRLSLWYAGTIAGMLIVLGAVIFITIRRQYSEQLTRSLDIELRQLESASRNHALGAEGPANLADGLREVEELHTPNRTYFLLQVSGDPVPGTPAPPNWVRDAARQAGAHGETALDWEPQESRDFRVRAERFLVTDAPYVAVAVADRVELEDQYASLIILFGGAAVAALLLVGATGWVLVGQSIAPIEAMIAHMRRFMADAAHELRTPVAVIRTSAEVALQQEREASAYVARLTAIEAESGRLARIVDDLFTLARADAGDRPVERARVYLDDLISDAVSAAHMLARPKQVSVEIREFEETMVEGDPTLLRQLAMIVLDNAVKFTRPGGRVTVDVRAIGATPCVIVEDSGVGIDADQLPHVFERFYRADSSRTRIEESGSATPGAGLGLSIARWIAGVHGARIDITSTPSVGTTVTIVFPPTRDATAEANPSASREQPSPPESGVRLAAPKVSSS